MNQNNCKFRWIYYHWAYCWRDGTNPVTVERHWVNYSAETSHQKYRPTQYRKLKYTNIGLIPTQVHLILCYIFQTYSITVICQYVSKLCTNSKKYLLCLIMLHIFIITLYEVISLPNWWVDMGYFFQNLRFPNFLQYFSDNSQTDMTDPYDNIERYVSSCWALFLMQ